MRSRLTRELVFLILQFLDEENFKETAYKLGQESGCYFDMKYFEDEVLNGNWDNVDKYLSGFIEVDDNQYSVKTLFEIRKQKYLEALDKREIAKAVEILLKDLKVFATFNEELFNEMTLLLTLDNFRENEQLSKYGDIQSARTTLLVELKMLIEANPLFQDKLQFPSIKCSRFRTLINQSLNWQHHLCKNPKTIPQVTTLFVDHSCGQPSSVPAPSLPNDPHFRLTLKARAFAPFSEQVSSQPVPPPVPITLAGWMSSHSPVIHPAASSGVIGLNAPTDPTTLKRSSTPPKVNPPAECALEDADRVLRTSPTGISPKVNLPVSYPQKNSQATCTLEDLPTTDARKLSQGSIVKSMDFHPIQQNILLVGTDVGDIAIWNIRSMERLVLKKFKVWEFGALFNSLEDSFHNYPPPISINRIIWSSEGSLFGVAYSRHIIQIYAYFGGGHLRQHLEINTHNGGTNNIAFAHTHDKLSIITCGDDKTIKVWDAFTGMNQYIFPAHRAPVYSIFPQQKQNIQFISSTSLDGKIEVQLYDTFESRVDYDAPGNWCITMSYSSNGARLFSCGSSKAGERIMVEWDESEGTVKRAYQGFCKSSFNIVQFDTTQNRFLAVGDDFLIKFWDMDNSNLLTAVDADGNPPIDGRNLMDVKLRITDKVKHKSEIWMLSEDNEPTQCRSSRLMDKLRTCKLCEWGTEGWEKRGSRFLPVPFAPFDSEILPSVYLPANISTTMYPDAVTAHPSKPNQFALGMTDGGVLEPAVPQGKWGVYAPPDQSCSSSSISSGSPRG